MGQAGAGALTPTGKLGVDADSEFGFYSISPLTGAAYRIDWFYEPVFDIAIPVNQQECRLLACLTGRQAVLSRIGEEHDITTTAENSTLLWFIDLA